MSERSMALKQRRIDVRFTSPTFGMQFSIPGSWKIRLADIKDGLAIVIAKAGPYPGRSGQVIPNVAIIARPPKPGETLADFANVSMPYPSGKSIPAPFCPAQECLAVEGIKPKAYEEEGDGYATIVVFNAMNLSIRVSFLKSR